MSSRISDLDHNGAQAIIATGQVFSSANPLMWVIEKLQNLPVDEKVGIDETTPSPLDSIKDGVKVLGNYHTKMLRNTSHWSHGVRNAVCWTSTQILHPLSFCKIGRAIQHSVSYDILGSLAQSIAFCALQIFHLIPYIMVGVLAAGTVSLYQNNPSALAAILLGGMLTSNLWFLYRLVKTVENTNKVWAKKADDLIAAINLVQFAKNTFWSGCDLAARGIRWGASWFPTGQAKDQSEEPQARIPIAQ